MLKKFGIIAALCIFVAGCSSLKFAYGFAETVVLDRVETYLDIREDDAPALEAEISSLVTWHRIEMLPKYAAYFEVQARMSEGTGWTKAESDTAVSEFRKLIRETSIGAAPFIARVLVNHTSDEKVDHIVLQVREQIAERREDYAEPLSEQIENSVKKSVSNYERFFGSLTEQQIAIVRDHKSKSYDPSGAWLDWREKRLQDLAAFLRTKPDIEEIQAYIKVALAEPEKIVGQAYRVRADKWWDAQAALNYALLQTLNDEQRQNFADNLRGYAVDMVELADAS